MCSARLCLHVFEAHRVKPPRPTSSSPTAPTMPLHCALHRQTLPATTIRSTHSMRNIIHFQTHTHFVIKLNRKHFKSTHTAKPRCCPRCTVRRRHLARRRNANAVVRTSTTAKMVHAQTQLNVFFNAAILHFLHYHVAPARARVLSLSACFRDYLRPLYVKHCTRRARNPPSELHYSCERERRLACACLPLLRA